MAPIGMSPRQAGAGPSAQAGRAPWYLDAVLYRVDVRAFQDSDGDGIGDLRGLTTRLDYLEDLGVDALCLMPVQPSPPPSRRAVADHRGVDPVLGTPRDFKALLREAHRRELRLLMDWVPALTSNEHPWFQRARRAPPRSSYRRYYRWCGALAGGGADPPARSAWDPAAGAHYRHSGDPAEPLLDLGHPAVLRALVAALRYWLKTGVDGFCLHGPFEAGEGRSEGEAGALGALVRDLRSRLQDSHPDAVFMATLDEWPDRLRACFAEGSGCQLATDGVLAARLFEAVAIGDRAPMVEVLQRTPASAEGGHWVTALRDERPLALGALPGEERDLLLRTYAADPRARRGDGIARRLAPLMEGDETRVRLALGLLLSLPGTPELLYGDEIRMGDNVYLPGAEGLRTPMQWSADRNGGFSVAEPSALFRPVNMDSRYGYPVTNAEGQQRTPSSALNWLRRTLSLRRRTRAFSRGDIEVLRPANARVLAYVRRWEDERVLCVVNLSRLTEPVELPLWGYAGLTPVEMWSHSTFPPIGQLPYFLILAPHAFYWFELVGTERFHSCFISYSSRDEVFAEQLYEDLTSRRVTAWKASRDLRAGQRFRDEIERRIRGADRVIVICSADSLASEEVGTEVELALAEEARRQEEGESEALVLLPISLDGALHRAAAGWPAEIRDSRHAGDFRQWRSTEDYEKALGLLLRELAESSSQGE